jgi:D-alanine-D-alanine ligase
MLQGRHLMAQLPRLRVVIVHNCDFDDTGRDDPGLASRADVVNAARDVAAALTALGHQVTTLPVTDGEAVVAATRALDAVRALGPDLVFNLCESLAGDSRNETVLPTLLELAGFRYTGSGPLALGLALRKDLTKRILRGVGVPTPDGVTLTSDSVAEVTLPFPLIVKPTREDASVGISRHSVVRDRRALAARVAEVRARFRQPVLVERFIDGRELYVSLIGREPAALPLHEIDFSTLPRDRPRIVSYDGKWDTASDEYQGTRPVRAVVDGPTLGRCVAAARAAFHARGLRDYARVDLRLAKDGTPYVIDVNPNCDLSDGAGVSRAASFGGLTYRDLIARICEAALARHCRESDLHDDRERAAATPARAAAPAQPAAAAAAAAHPAPAAGRPRSPGGAARGGRAVQPGGAVGRAPAHRRRAR